MLVKIKIFKIGTLYIVSFKDVVWHSQQIAQLHNFSPQSFKETHCQTLHHVSKPNLSTVLLLNLCNAT